MPDVSLSSPKDNTASTPYLTDAQVGNAVANQFLAEVNASLKPSDSNTQNLMTEGASNELAQLKGDPQQSAVINAIAGKIESNDPSLGVLQGQVERDAQGDIAGFVFTDPQQKQTYENSVAKTEAEGATFKQAIGEVGPNVTYQTEARGVMDISVNGTINDNTQHVLPK